MRAIVCMGLRVQGVVGALILLGLISCVQARPASASETAPAGYPWDWSHEHVIFSNPTDPEVLKKIQQDPRLLHQQLRQNPSSLQARANATRERGFFSAALEHLAAALHVNYATSVQAAQSPAGQPGSSPLTASRLRILQIATVILGLSFAAAFLRKRHWTPSLAIVLAITVFLALSSCTSTMSVPAGLQSIHADWGANIGAASAITPPNSLTAQPMYPAKYSFNVSQNPDCTNDFVVFATGASGTNTGAGNHAPSIIAFNDLYSTQAKGGYCNTAGPSVAWSYLNVTCATSTTNSSDPIKSSPVLSLDGKKVAWVTSTGKVQILTMGTVGTNGTSATNPVCIQNAPGGAATSINNAVLNSVTLSDPNGATASVTLSEIFVDYGTDSAYVGDDQGFMHKISPFFGASSALTEMTTPTWTASKAYSVGNLIIDSNGFIEKCTKAGTTKTGTHPTWSTTWGGTTTDNTVTWTSQGSGGGWPVYVTGSSTHLDYRVLSGPVYDVVSKNIFVGHQSGGLYYVLDPGASTAVGSCANGATLYPCLGKPGTTSGISTSGARASLVDCAAASPGPTCMVMANQPGYGFVDSVIVDSSNNMVIAQFSDVDGTSAKVEQTNTSLNVFNSTTLAGRLDTLAYHTGAFDNTYYSTPASGYYYVCGPNSAGTATNLYRVGFTNTSGVIALGSKDSSSFQLTVSNNIGNCSPLTEIYNTTTSTDWLFLSVDTQGVTSTCGGVSCVMSFTLGSSMVSSASASYKASANMTGTSGFVVDNVANTTTYPQASSIYFAPVATNLTCGDGSSSTACAIKLTQSALQ